MSMDLTFNDFFLLRLLEIYQDLQSSRFPFSLNQSIAIFLSSSNILINSLILITLVKIMLSNYEAERSLSKGASH